MMAQNLIAPSAHGCLQQPPPRQRGDEAPVPVSQKLSNTMPIISGTRQSSGNYIGGAEQVGNPIAVQLLVLYG
jgi:hypothetical protein